jgi:hypothetical protein
MKRLFAMILLAAIMLSLAACGSDEALAAKQSEIDQLKGQLAAKQEEVDVLKASEESLKMQLAGLAGSAPIHKLYAVYATVDGKSAVDFTGEGSFTATAVLAEGQVVDHWELNGQAQPNSAQETFSFRADGDTLVVAVVRAEKKLVTINAEFRFLDKSGSPAGEKYTEFVFEKDYVNPVSYETCAGGEISAEITAVIPNGKMVDYWLINGVPYHFKANVNSFIVDHLDEATTYEVVLKDIPITYYRVTCDGCTFDGKKEGYVAAGTTIKVMGNSGYASRFYINGQLYKEYVNYITIVINEDTRIECYQIIN